MSKADIKAGGAFIHLFLKDDTAKGLKTAINTVATGLATAVKAFAAATTAAMTAGGFAAKHFANVGSEIADMAARTGLAVDNLVELKFAAEQSGAALADVETAIKLSQKEGKDFFEIADAIAAIEDPAKRTQMALENWGKSGTMLLPMIEGLEDLRREARDLGLVPTEDEIKRADALDDAFAKFKGTLSMAWFKFGSNFAHILTPMLENLAKIVAVTTKWTVENEKVIEFFKRLGDAIPHLSIVSFHQKLQALVVALREVHLAFAEMFIIEGDTFFGRALPILRDQLEESKRELTRLTHEMLGMGQQQGQQEFVKGKSDSDKPPNTQVQSAWSAAGAVAMQWAGKEGGVGGQMLGEMRALRKIAAEDLRLAKEMWARRAKPGIFR